MFLIRFERDNEKVIARFDSNLETCKPIFPFTFDCEDQEFAELLQRHFNEEKWKMFRQIAGNAHYYLKPEEITVLKRKLKNWNGHTHSWK